MTFFSRELFGLRFFSDETSRLTEYISKSLAKGKKIRIFTPNSEMLYRAREDNTFFELLFSADVLIPDGSGIFWSSYILKAPLRERMTGIDMAEKILRLAESESLSVFLLGGKDGIAAEAATRLKVKYPNLNICGTHNGYFDKIKASSENVKVLRAIQDARPQILFVCLGSPMQEKWICENLGQLPSPCLAMGLGGSLDVWSGSAHRAPIPIQRVGLEWIWRTLCQPKRLYRIPYLFKFAFTVAKEKIRN